MGFNNIENTDNSSVIVDDFKYLSMEGKIYNSKEVPGYRKVNQLNWSQIGNQYKLKIGIIPLKKGIYLLGVSDGLGKKKNKDCYKANFSFTLIQNNSNLHLYENRYGNLSEYDHKRSYCFQVID